MDQQPKIPTLKDAQKPQVKIKGMGAGLTLFDRLKQFKKKDLAFILAGLGTLFMAPLAEHFMMAPENGDMSSGFRGPGSGSGTGLFGSGSSPYESGNNGIAQGGAIGGAGDIITPLNVRDPSALVMGPGSSQQPPAGSAAAATPPVTAPTTTSDELKDALSQSAIRAGSAAVKKAPLPIPKITFTGSGLRGLGAASGGSSSGSGSLGPINSGNLGQAGTGGGGLNLVRAAPNFRGAAGARGPNSPSGLDGTKKAGANAGDAFSRQGSAMSGLNAAASEQIPTGGQGFGGGGQGGMGANDKPGGGAGAAGSKSVGESLAFIEAKERMMEKLKLEFEKKKLWDTGLLMGGIRNDMAKGFGTELGKVLTKHALAPLSKEFWAKEGEGTPGWKCGASHTFYPKSNADICVTDSGNLGTPGEKGCTASKDSSGATIPCTPYTQPGKAAPATGAAEGGVVDGSAGMSPGDMATLKKLGDACQKAIDEDKPDSNADVKIWAKSLAASANHLVSAQSALMGTPEPAPCKGKRIIASDATTPKSLKELQADALKLIAGVAAADEEALTGKIKKGAIAEKPLEKDIPVADAVKAVLAAQTALEAIQAHMKLPSTPDPLPAVLKTEAEKASAQGLVDQVTAARNTANLMLGNLETVQKGFDTGMAEIQKMAGTGTALKDVIATNEALAKVAAKTAPAAGYEGLEKAPAVVVPKVADHSDEAKTKAAISAVTEPNKTADGKVEDYKTALGKVKGDTAHATVAQPKKDADGAVKTAVEKDGAMRTSMIGWVDKTKSDLDALAKYVVSPVKP